MRMFSHASLEVRHQGGATCRVVLGPALGMGAARVLRWTLPPGVGVDLRPGAAAFAVIVATGLGKQRLAGAPHPFMAPCTLLVPAGIEHEVVNTGQQTMELLVVEPLAEKSPDCAKPDACMLRAKRAGPADQA